ncbi:hypothetical protein TNCV_1243291 [Trichonephila clavipes]|nr:hypothetical protein TNCV_1243291 [Trichonephila clavipes]
MGKHAKILRFKRMEHSTSELTTKHFTPSYLLLTVVDKVTESGWHVMSSSLVPLKIHREERADAPIRRLLETDFVNLNPGQVTKTTPQLAPALLTSPPYQQDDI